MKRIACVLVLGMAAAVPAAANPASPDKADRKAPPAASAPAVVAPLPRPPRTPEPPARPAEIAALGKRLAGAWSCKGVGIRSDGSSHPLQSTVSIKLDLDDAWLVTALVDTTSHVKVTEYRTYDATAKEWTRVQLASTQAHVVSTSPGETGGKWTWTGTATSPMGTMQLRDYEQQDGQQRKLWGEAQIGGTWQKTYDVTCKR